MPKHFTPEIITAAIEGFESQKRRLDDQIAELRSMLPGGTAEAAAKPEAPRQRRRKFSAAAIHRMREAQQRRWAKVRGESEPSAPVEPPKSKRKLSAAAKAKLVANLKKARAAKAAKAKTAAKKTAPARKKTAVKRAAPAKAARRALVKKTALVKRTAPPTKPQPETVAQ